MKGGVSFVSFPKAWICFQTWYSRYRWKKPKNCISVVTIWSDMVHYSSFQSATDIAQKLAPSLAHGEGMQVPRHWGQGCVCKQASLCCDRRAAKAGASQRCPRRQGTGAWTWLSGQENLAAGAIRGVLQDIKHLTTMRAQVFREKSCNRLRGKLVWALQLFLPPFPCWKRYNRVNNWMSLNIMVLAVWRSAGLIGVPQSSTRGRGRKSCDKKRWLAECSRGAQPKPALRSCRAGTFSQTQRLAQGGQFISGLSVSTNNGGFGAAHSPGAEGGASLHSTGPLAWISPAKGQSCN